MRSMESVIGEILPKLEEYRLGSVGTKELKTLLEALSLALGRNDDLMVNALLIGVDNFCANHHRAKNIYKQLAKYTKAD